MTQAPSIKEALEFYADPFAWKRKNDPENVVFVPDHYEVSGFGDTAKAALATFQPDGERREAIARALDEVSVVTEHSTVYCKGVGEIPIIRLDAESRARVVDAIALASGLVQNEAGIRRDERKKLRNRLDSHLNDFLCGMKEGWDDSVSGFNDAWDVVRKVFDAAAIRSARDGGAES